MSDNLNLTKRLKQLLLASSALAVFTIGGHSMAMAEIDTLLDFSRIEVGSRVSFKTLNEGVKWAPGSSISVMNNQLETAPRTILIDQKLSYIKSIFVLNAAFDPNDVTNTPVRPIEDRDNTLLFFQTTDETGDLKIGNITSIVNQEFNPKSGITLNFGKAGHSITLVGGYGSRQLYDYNRGEFPVYNPKSDAVSYTKLTAVNFNNVGGKLTIDTASKDEFNYPGQFTLLGNERNKSQLIVKTPFVYTGTSNNLTNLKTEIHNTKVTIYQDVDRYTGLGDFDLTGQAQLVINIPATDYNYKLGKISPSADNTGIVALNFLKAYDHEDGGVLDSTGKYTIFGSYDDSSLGVSSNKLEKLVINSGQGSTELEINIPVYAKKIVFENTSDNSTTQFSKEVDAGDFSAAKFRSEYGFNNTAKIANLIINHSGNKFGVGEKGELVIDRIINTLSAPAGIITIANGGKFIPNTDTAGIFAGIDLMVTEGNIVQLTPHKYAPIRFTSEQAGAINVVNGTTIKSVDAISAAIFSEKGGNGTIIFDGSSNGNSAAGRIEGNIGVTKDGKNNAALNSIILKNAATAQILPHQGVLTNTIRAEGANNKIIFSLDNVVLGADNARHVVVSGVTLNQANSDDSPATMKIELGDAENTIAFSNIANNAKKEAFLYADIVPALAKKATILVDVGNKSGVSLMRALGDNNNPFGKVSVASGRIIMPANSNISEVVVGKGSVVEFVADSAANATDAVPATPKAKIVNQDSDNRGQVIFTVFGSGSYGNIVLGTDITIGTKESPLSYVQLGKAEQTTTLEILLSQGVQIYADEIAAYNDEGISSALVLEADNYDLGNIGYNSKDLKRGGVKFGLGYLQIGTSEGIGNAGVGTVTLKNAQIYAIKFNNSDAILELQGEKYNIGRILDTEEDLASTLVFNNPKALKLDKLQIGNSSAIPFNTVIFKGEKVDFDADAIFYVNNFLFEKDTTVSFYQHDESVIKNFKSKGFIGTLIAKKLPAAAENSKLVISESQEADSAVREIQVQGVDLTIGNGDNEVITYTNFTTDSKLPSSITLAGTGTVYGAIGTEKAKSAMVVIANDSTQTISNAVYTQAFNIGGKVTLNNTETQVAGIYGEGTITMGEENATLILGDKTEIQANILAYTNGYGAITANGKGKVGAIGSDDAWVNNVTFAALEDRDDCNEVRVNGNIYTNNFNVTESGILVGTNDNSKQADILIHSTTTNLQDASLSMGNNALTLKADTITLAGEKLDIYVSSNALVSANKKEKVKGLIIDAATIEYSKLDSIVPHIDGALSVLPADGAKSGVKIINFTDAVSAEDQKALYAKIAAVQNASEYVKFYINEDHELLSAVDFSPYQANMKKHTENPTVLAMTQLIAKKPADKNQDLYLSVYNAELDKPGRSLEILESLAPTNTELSVIKGTTDLVTGMVPSVMNSALPAAGDNDESFKVVAQVFMGGSAQNATEYAKGYKAGIKGLVIGGKYVNDFISGSIAFVGTTQEIAKKASDIDLKGNASSMGGIASVTYNLLEGVYATVNGGWSRNTITDQAARKTSLTSSVINSTEFAADSWYLQAFAGTNLAFSESVSFSPMIGIKYLGISPNDHEEKGTSALKMAFKDGSYHNVKGVIGAKVSGALTEIASAKISGEIHANIAFDVFNSGSTKLAVAGSGGPEITVPVLLNKNFSPEYNAGLKLSAEVGTFNAHLGVDLRLTSFNTEALSWVAYARTEVGVY